MRGFIAKPKANLCLPLDPLPMLDLMPHYKDVGGCFCGSLCIKSHCAGGMQTLCCISHSKQEQTEQFKCDRWVELKHSQSCPHQLTPACLTTIDIGLACKSSSCLLSWMTAPLPLLTRGGHSNWDHDQQPCKALDLTKQLWYIKHAFAKQRNSKQVLGYLSPERPKHQSVLSSFLKITTVP